MPGVAVRQDNPPPPTAYDQENSGRKVRRRRNGGGRDIGDHDPLILGLFRKLPEPKDWPASARLKWLQTAANIFHLVYKGRRDRG
jgi:hypothetical protein